MGRILCLAYEEVLGHNGLAALLKMAGYEQYVQAPPPGNSDRQFPFAAVSGLTQAATDLYGPRGGRGILQRVGRVCFKHGVREYGDMLGITDLTFQLLPFSIKLEKGIRALADLFNTQTDQVVRVQETPDMLYWTVERCPVCWQLEASQPTCQVSVGLFQEALQWLSGGKTFVVEEQTCVACGDDACTIAIAKLPLD
jgi:predicted hydrocarbon binding protein